jgi:serine/threonine-protein kinase
VGTVVSVSPTGTVTEFSPVTITVSKGPPMVAVPEISSGTPLGAAEAALRHAGLNWDVQKVYGGFLGRVVRTDPPSGTEVRVGSTVTLTVV